MCKIAEIEQHYHETCEKFNETIGDKGMDNYTQNDYEIFIERLEAEKQYRKIKDSNPIYVTLLNEKIARAKARRDAQKFLQSR